MAALGPIVGRACLLTGAAVLLGVAFNAVNPRGIELVAPREYEVYVPCPEALVESETIGAEDLAGDSLVLYLDARPESEYRQMHIAGAESFPYPLLDEPDPARIAALKRRGVRIVTYGDGGLGDLGEALANLLVELEVPEVRSLEGGLPAWRERGGATEGEGGGDEPEAAPGGEGGPEAGSDEPHETPATPADGGVR